MNTDTQPTNLTTEELVAQAVELRDAFIQTLSAMRKLASDQRASVEVARFNGDAEAASQHAENARTVYRRMRAITSEAENIATNAATHLDNVADIAMDATTAAVITRLGE